MKSTHSFCICKYLTKVLGSSSELRPMVSRTSSRICKSSWESSASCLAEDHDLYLYETSEALLEQVRETELGKSGFSTFKQDVSGREMRLKISEAREKAPLGYFPKYHFPFLTAHQLQHNKPQPTAFPPGSVAHTHTSKKHTPTHSCYLPLSGTISTFIAEFLDRIFSRLWKQHLRVWKKKIIDVIVASLGW